MNKRLLPFLFLISHYGLAQPRTIQTLHDQWKFAQGNHPHAMDGSFYDEAWSKVTLPHHFHRLRLGRSVETTVEGLVVAVQSLQVTGSGRRDADIGSC